MTSYEALYGEPLPDCWEVEEAPLKSYHRKQGVNGASLSLHDSIVEPFLGRISLEVYLPKQARLSVKRHLEKHFRNPFKPTEEERTLFEIEHGFSYPFQ